jgi:hypothetical protein
MAEVGVNSSGYADMTVREHGRTRHIGFVSQLATSLHQPGADHDFEPALLFNQASRQLVLNRKFFERLAASIEVAKRRLEPEGDGSEYDDDDARRARLTGRSRTLTIDSFLFTIRSEMSAAALLPETLPTAVPADWGRPLVERQLALLGRLAEAGLEIALALEAQAKGADAVVQGDVAMAYARVARAVRQTIMLQSRLIETLRERAEAGAGRKAAAARIIGDAIEDETGHDVERGERLAGEAAERLRQEDFGDLLARPFGEAVAEIVRDLGLSPDWLGLAEDCYAAEAALGGKAAGKTPEEPIYRGPVEVRWLDDDDLDSGSDSS